jgi:SAM-dependent methyltransferase
MSMHPFDRSGLAALSDLERPEWRALFGELEAAQRTFDARAGALRGDDYKWPRDPLHTWSRCWEYPYTFHHLRARRAALAPALATGAPPPLVVDVGSGVTFFPFACAGLGYRVACTDVDPAAERDLPRARDAMPAELRAVEFRRTDGATLPFQDGEADVVYCVSVLEHIPTWERTVTEMARVLKPRGLLVLTIDLDLLGTAELSPAAHRRLLDVLDARFTPAQPERAVHPLDVLVSSAGPYPLRGPVGLARAWFYAKQYLIKPALGRKPVRVPGGLHLAVHGLVLERR